MATVKRANVAPTHPTVWIGLALATVGLLVAVYAYTGARVYDIVFAFVALIGAILALTGILVAAWGRSLMAARASRSRRAAISSDAMTIAKPEPEPAKEPTSEDAPTIAPAREKKGFSFSMPKRAKKEKEKEAKKDATPAGVFAFRRREPEPEVAPEPEPEPIRLAPEPAPALPAEEPIVTLAPPAPPVRVTLRCPSCSTTFSAEGSRPFQAVCGNCGFSATV